jgi:hypothetical protein
MPGMGEKYLPKPQFSASNPYWWGKNDRNTFLLPEFRPRPTARDFLYATTWEIWRPDWHMAYCIRIAMQRTVRINWHMGIARQLQKSTLKEKEGNEKTA